MNMLGPARNLEILPMKRPLLALGLAITLGACTQVPHERSTDPKYAANGEALVCERVPIPGKIYPGKVCMTEKQWDRHRQAGRDSTNDAQRSALGTPAPGGNGG